jgi:hypothetical protein
VQWLEPRRHQPHRWLLGRLVTIRRVSSCSNTRLQLFEDLPALLLGAANAADATEATAKVEEKRILAG